MGSAKNGAQNLLLVRCSEESPPQKLPPPAEREISKGVSKEEVGGGYAERRNWHSKIQLAV
jgi:hypothetical protein